MTYTIRRLNEQLVLIQWVGNPGREECKQYLQELTELLNDADDGLYFISDLRRGRIIDIRSIQELSHLSEHENWSGSVAFTDDIISGMFVNTYRRFLHEGQERNILVGRADEAVAFLEGLQPGLTGDIDWESVLQ